MRGQMQVSRGEASEVGWGVCRLYKTFASEQERVKEKERILGELTTLKEQLEQIRARRGASGLCNSVEDPNAASPVGTANRSPLESPRSVSPGYHDRHMPSRGRGIGSVIRIEESRGDYSSPMDYDC